MTHQRPVLRLIGDLASHQDESAELDRLRAENENLKRQVRILSGHTREYALLRRIMRENEDDKPIKGVWLP